MSKGVNVVQQMKILAGKKPMKPHTNAPLPSHIACGNPFLRSSRNSNRDIHTGADFYVLDTDDLLSYANNPDTYLKSLYHEKN